MADNGTSARTTWRLEQLEKARDQDREAYKWLSEMGQKHNEQIKAQDERLAAIEKAAERVPVLEERVSTILKSLDRAKTAGWATAGSLLVLAAAVILNGGAS